MAKKKQPKKDSTTSLEVGSTVIFTRKSEPFAAKGIEVQILGYEADIAIIKIPGYFDQYYGVHTSELAPKVINAQV